MVNFIIGRENIDLTTVDLDSRIYFKYSYKPEWFNNSFAKRVLKEIDKAELIADDVFRGRNGKAFPAVNLSTGTKTLLLIKFRPGHIYYGSALGNNCVPFLMEIAKEQEKTGMGDITLLLEHFMDIPDCYEGMIKLNGIPATLDEYDDAIVTWCEHRDNPDYKWYGCKVDDYDEFLAKMEERFG